MANATAITVRSLTANSVTVATADLVTNGGSALTLDASVAGLTDRCVLVVTNNNTTASELLTVKVNGDGQPPAYKGTLAGLTKSNIATAAVWAFGPFNPGLFSYNGVLSVTFSPATGGALNFDVQCLRLPAIV